MTDYCNVVNICWPRRTAQKAALMQHQPMLIAMDRHLQVTRQLLVVSSKQSAVV